MRILVLAPQPFMTQRGTPIAVKMLLETLSARGDTLDVITFAEGEDVQIAGCRLFRVPALPGLGGIPPGFSLRKAVADVILGAMAAWRMLRSRYDLVIGIEEAGYIAMILRPVFRVPYVLDVDSSIPEQLGDKYRLPGWFMRFLDRVEGAAARRAVAAIACCAALRDTIRGHATDLPILVLEDVTMLDPDVTFLPPLDLRFDAPVVMYVGNLEPYQGVDLLLDAFALIDTDRTPAHLVVIGGQADHIAAFRRKVAAMGLSQRVHFPGPRPVGDLGHVLAAADIVVSPRTQGRNTPMKVYSYLDSGRPLVATRLPTHTQVLDNTVAVLVDPDPQDMARGLESLLADPLRRDSLARTAALRVRADFSPPAYRRKLLGFVDDVIEPSLKR